MEWIKIDKYNLPKGNVLAACFDNNTKSKPKIVGYLMVYNNEVYCFSNDWEINVTHYIDINKFDL